MHTAQIKTVSNTEKISVLPVAGDFDEHADIYAINWFDLKTPWLYRLYGLIAYRYVRKVSGRLCFKGNLIRQIAGPTEHRRENLLIVCYPGARKFLDLLHFRAFRLASALRLLAVRKFVFGFTENIIQKSDSNDAHDHQFSKQQVYLVHHFRGDTHWLRDKHLSLFEEVQRHRSQVYFCGLTNAHIAREKSGHQQSPDFFMDGILVFAANSAADVENVISDTLYTNFMCANNDNSLYLFSRSH